jgi:hypothetical protein
MRDEDDLSITVVVDPAAKSHRHGIEEMLRQTDFKICTAAMPAPVVTRLLLGRCSW